MFRTKWTFTNRASRPSQMGAAGWGLFDWDREIPAHVAPERMDVICRIAG
jgi:hypothetical protein